MLRIGIVTGEYPPHQGGVGDFSREIARALAALGHEVHVITHREAQADPEIRLHPVVRSWGVLSLLQVRQIARSIPLDVVNIQYQAAAYGLSAPIHFLPRLLAPPTVVTFHDLRIPYLFPGAGGLRQKAVYALGQSAAGVIVTNYGDRRQLEAETDISRIAEIPIGSNVHPAALHTGRRAPEYAARFGFNEGDAVAGYFGFLNMSKGGELLFNALAHSPNLKLLLIGGRTGTADRTNAAYAAELDSLAARLGLTGRIVRTGYLPARETSEAFLACDFMAMPYADGVSLRRGSFMACLAHGMPTLTTAPQVLIPELRDRHNVLLVPPGRLDALTAGLQTLAADAALRARLAAGAAQLGQRFRWDKIAEQTAAFFAGVRQAPAPGSRRR